MDQKAIALAAAKALDAKRGKDIVVLKVDEMTVITDYMVIATGRSVPQVKALAENVEEELAKLDLFARRREGVNEGHWCILDYGDVMVHIFHEHRRYPANCQQTDTDPETGCMEFDIEKGRFSFRLTAPYSEERREATRRYARENSTTNLLK